MKDYNLLNNVPKITNDERFSKLVRQFKRMQKEELSKEEATAKQNLANEEEMQKLKLAGDAILIDINKLDTQIQNEQAQLDEFVDGLAQKEVQMKEADQQLEETLLKKSNRQADIGKMQ